MNRTSTSDWWPALAQVTDSSIVVRRRYSLAARLHAVPNLVQHWRESWPGDASFPREWQCLPRFNMRVGMPVG